MSEEIDNSPKNAFDAAIDAATGCKPGEENRVVADAEQNKQGEGGGAEAADVRTADETKPAADETKPAADETKPAADETKPTEAKEKRDWVKEAWECFIKNAVDLEPMNPAAAVWEYFKKNATDDLKAKVEQEGKTGASCWKFIEAVARKALGGKSGHIDPVAIYAIAMHYFQDVPKDWDKVEKPARREAASVRTEKGKSKKVEELERKIAQPGSAKHAQELKAKLKAEKERIKEKERKQRAKKRGGEQGFFFDLMETETVGPKEEVK